MTSLCLHHGEIARKYPKPNVLEVHYSLPRDLQTRAGSLSNVMSTSHETGAVGTTSTARTGEAQRQAVGRCEGCVICGTSWHYDILLLLYYYYYYCYCYCYLVGGLEQPCCPSPASGAAALANPRVLSFTKYLPWLRNHSPWILPLFHLVGPSQLLLIWYALILLMIHVPAIETFWGFWVSTLDCWMPDFRPLRSVMQL